MLITYIVYIFLTLLGLIFMKLGNGDINIFFDNSKFGFSMNYKIILALIFYFSSFFMWIKIVGKNDLSYIVPFTSSICNILVFIIGLFLFKENVNLHKILGLILAIIGSVLLNYK